MKIYSRKIVKKFAQRFPKIRLTNSVQQHAKQRRALVEVIDVQRILNFFLGGYGER